MTHGSNETVLTGLDASNPLGFLACLGTLRILDERCTESAIRMSFREMGRWTPVLHHRGDLDLVTELDGDRQSRSGTALELSLVYEDGKGRNTYELKPPPAVYADFMVRARSAAVHGEPRVERFAAAYASDVVQDNSGQTKPTHLHFLAGQQRFLHSVRSLAEEVTSEDFTEALLGPWRYERELPVLRWDSRGERSHALLGFDPGERRNQAMGVPAADWLAFNALPYFPVAPSQGALHTPGFVGRWKQGSFVWPLWTRPVGSSAAADLLRLGGYDVLAADARKAWHIGAVFEASFWRSDQGGYGSFGGAKAV